jgi:hypothetical protein
MAAQTRAVAVIAAQSNLLKLGMFARVMGEGGGYKHSLQLWWEFRQFLVAR